MAALTGGSVVVMRVQFELPRVKPNIICAVNGRISGVLPCAFLMTLMLLLPPGAFAQDPSMDTEKIVEKLDQLDDTIGGVGTHSNYSTIALFSVGVAISLIAVLATRSNGHHLKRQADYFDSHLDFLERAARNSLQPVLSWTTLEGGSTHMIGQPSDGSKTITVRILNVGFAPALNITSIERYGMTASEGKLKKLRTTYRSWGSLSPRGFMEVSIPVSPDEYAQSLATGGAFHAKIRLTYTTMGKEKMSRTIHVIYSSDAVDIRGSAS